MHVLSLLDPYPVVSLPIGHRDRHRRVPLHEPTRGKALYRSAGAAMDDEVGQDGADHRNKLEAMT